MAQPRDPTQGPGGRAPHAPRRSETALLDPRTPITGTPPAGTKAAAPGSSNAAHGPLTPRGRAHSGASRRLARPKGGSGCKQGAPCPHLLVLVDYVGGNLLADNLPEDGVPTGARGLRLTDLVSHADAPQHTAHAAAAALSRRRSPAPHGAHWPSRAPSPVSLFAIG